MQVHKVLGRMLNFAVLLAGTLAYVTTIAGVMLFGVIWEGWNRLSATVRALRSRRLT